MRNTPLLRALRETFPAARITFLVKKQYAELLNGSPFIDEIILLDTKEGFRGLRRIRQQLRTRHYDLYVDIHKNWRSLYIRLGLGARMTGTYPKHIFRRTMLIWFKLNLYRHIRPVYLRYFDSVRKLGIPYDGKGTEVFVPQVNLDRVRGMLASHGFGNNQPLVIICPGATYFNKRWPATGFVETAQFLIRERSAFVIIHGGKEDIGLCVDIASKAPGALSLAGMLSLADSAALLRMSTLVIANDSGLLHLAQSQKIPVIGIYGPTTREFGFYPIEQDSTVVETSLACRPCTSKGLDRCPKKHFRCMKDIPADRVIQAALQYL